MREYTPVVIAVKSLPPNDVAWECPFCEMCFPALGKWDHEKAVSHHYRVNHPKRDTSRRAVMAARAKLMNSRRTKSKRHELSLKITKRILKRASQKRDLLFGGRILVPLNVDSVQWPSVRSKKPVPFLQFFHMSKMRRCQEVRPLRPAAGSPKRFMETIQGGSANCSG